MKRFLKILFFILTTIIITVEETKSSTVVTILQEKTSYSFIQKSQLGDILFENHNANYCLKEKNVVACWSLIAKVKDVVAKGGGIESLINKHVVKTITNYDSKLGQLVEYPKYNNVALGKDMGGKLEAFGKDVGANVWTRETEAIFTKMYDLPNSWSFERSMTSVLNETVGSNQGKILFDISGVDIPKAIKGGLIHNSELVLRNSVTELELQMILRNKSWYDNVIFHENGKVLIQEELVNKGIKLLQ